jgi:hypothetical protein
LLIGPSNIQNEIGKDVIMIGAIIWHRTRDRIPFEGMWRNDWGKDEREDENNVVGRKEYFQLLLFGI